MSTGIVDRLVEIRRTALAKVLCCAALLLASANTVSAGSAEEIDSSVNAAFERLFATTPQAVELAESSVAILMFPEIIKGGVIVGGQYGEGAMREGERTTGYYSIAAASFGLQFGGQTFGYAMFFLNEEALAFVRQNDGWEVGVGPTLVGGSDGWSTSMGTNDLQGDIAVVFFGQEGLMAGSGVQGSKITRIER